MYFIKLFLASTKAKKKKITTKLNYRVRFVFHRVHISNQNKNQHIHKCSYWLGDASKISKFLNESVVFYFFQFDFLFIFFLARFQLSYAYDKQHFVLVAKLTINKSNFWIIAHSLCLIATQKCGGPIHVRVQTHSQTYMCIV